MVVNTPVIISAIVDLAVMVQIGADLVFGGDACFCVCFFFFLFVLLLLVSDGVLVVGRFLDVMVEIDWLFLC